MEQGIRKVIDIKVDRELALKKLGKVKSKVESLSPKKRNILIATTSAIAGAAIGLAL